jgi:ABC-2 type transport system ATP-binding protein
VTEHPQWRIVFDGDVKALRTWIGTVKGVRALTDAEAPGLPHDTVVFEDDETRPDVEQEVLKGAIARGGVREYALVRPSLVDLFRDIVSAEGVAA